MGKLMVLSVFSVISFLGTSKSTEYFDLGYDLDSTNIFYPGQRFFYELFKDIESQNYTVPDHILYSFQMYSFCMGEHGGTHLDAPFHFNSDGWKLGEIPLDRLVDIRAAVVDVEEEVFGMKDPRNFQLEVGHILEHERRYGRIDVGSVVIVHTGWGERYWPDFGKYMGVENDTLNFPGLSEDAAKWLVNERKIVALGIDTASADVGNFKTIGAPRVHLILCGNQVYIIENMTNLRKLLEVVRPSVSATSGSTSGLEGNSGKCDLRLIVMPIKSKGTGGPARVAAYCK